MGFSTRMLKVSLIAYSASRLLFITVHVINKNKNINLTCNNKISPFAISFNKGWVACSCQGPLSSHPSSTLLPGWLVPQTVLKRTRNTLCWRWSLTAKTKIKTIQSKPSLEPATCRFPSLSSAVRFSYVIIPYLSNRLLKPTNQLIERK